jgi:GT2 family glycosyltransferase/glycosyltransferase involved in cell wall biosynthesis
VNIAKTPWTADRFTGAVVPDRWGTPITVIVTVHDAYHETAACLAAVIDNTNHPYRLLIVDDASTDERMAPALAALAERHDHVTVVRNAERLGYTASVNIGWRQATGDVLLLNSDTIVTRGWLGRLAQVARSERNVATVTAVSNAAGSFSVPVPDVDNRLPEGMTAQDMADLVLAISPRSIPRAPTGNGFCMYVNRVALERTGGFDQDAFPDGYGEENDFCLRATAKGFVHLVDDRTYVYHRHAASYGERRAALLERNLATLRARHPGYPAEVAAWRGTNTLGLLRQRLSRALRRGRPNAEPGRDEVPVLYVTNEGFGGVQNTTLDLLRVVSRTHPCVLLTTGLGEWTIREFPQTTGEQQTVIRFATPWKLSLPLDAARVTSLRTLCKRYGIRVAHVRHMLGNAPEIVDILKSENIPVVFSVHDFYTVCPTVKLLDEQGSYCGGRCTEGQGDCPGEGRYAERFPFLKHRYVNEWRRRTAAALARCSSLVSTSRHVRDVVVQAMPELNLATWNVIEHGRDTRMFQQCARPPGGGRLVVLFFGQLTEPKGAEVLRRLCELNRERGEPFEMHFLGTRGSFSYQEVDATWHGEYRREELPQKLAKIRPTVTLIPSQWPETYCHVLTESWAAGVPVVASEMGALATRVRQHGGGWLVSDIGDAEAWFETLQQALQTPNGEYAQRRKAVGEYVPVSLEAMAAEYLAVYAGALEPAGVGGGGGGVDVTVAAAGEGDVAVGAPAMRRE